MASFFKISFGRYRFPRDFKAEKRKTSGKQTSTGIVWMGPEDQYFFGNLFLDGITGMIGPTARPAIIPPPRVRRPRRLVPCRGAASAVLVPYPGGTCYTPIVSRIPWFMTGSTYVDSLGAAYLPTNPLPCTIYIYGMHPSGTCRGEGVSHAVGGFSLSSDSRGSVRSCRGHGGGG